jgi:hypothetical protein
VQLGFSIIAYDKVYDDNSQKQPLNTNVRDNVVQLFGDLGLSDKLTLTTMIPFKLLTARPKSGIQPESESGGIGDIELALRHSWLNKGGNAFSTAIEVGIPSGQHNDPQGLYLGDGEVNVTARLLYGHSWYPLPLYCSADAAIDFRTNDFANDFFYNLEAGYGFMENRLYVILRVSGRESTSSKPTIRSTSSASDIAAAGLGLLTNNQEYAAIIPKVLYRFHKHWGAIGSWGTAIHGRNVAGGFVFAGGIFYEF